MPNVQTFGDSGASFTALILRALSKFQSVPNGYVIQECPFMHVFVRVSESVLLSLISAFPDMNPFFLPD